MQHTSVNCDKCNIRIPKNRRNLVCSQCRCIKHYKCYNLTKADVANIIDYPGYRWSCTECMSEILPINACSYTSRSARSKTDPHSDGIRFKAKCHGCDGMSYSQNNVVSCPCCNNICHKKCVKGILGCIKCCNDIIPGFNCHMYELYDNIGHNKNCIYNPYDLNNNVNLIGNLISNEEENNAFWNEISEQLISCTYKTLRNVQVAKPDELNILTVNIRSTHKNLQKIIDNAVEYQKYDVLCLNETNCDISKLANGIDDLLVEGFNPPIFQAPARASCKGGGLMTYVNNNICSADDLEKIDLGLDVDGNTIGEFLFVKIKSCKKTNKTVISGNVYRSPSNKNKSHFIDMYDKVLGKLVRHKGKQIIVSGDFNIDLIKYNSETCCQDLIDTASNHGFVQIISRPTRVTDHSATLIDHVYTNKINSVVSSCVVTLDLSDHLATCVTVSLDSTYDRAQYNLPNRRDNSEQLEYRLYNEANNEKFKSFIEAEDWDALLTDDTDAESQYNKFIDIYSKHYDAAYPLNTKRVRREHERVNPKPWITSWLEDACDRKNNLFHDWAKGPTISKRAKYDKMNLFCEKHIARAKNKYYKKYFNEYKDNSRKQWQMINGLLNRNKRKISVTKLFDSDGRIINSPELITEKFNEYFANIASDLKAKIDVNSSGNFEDFLTDPVTNSIYLKPVESGEVSRIISNLKNKATLDTKISSLKLAAENPKFTETLAKVITTSFEQGICPQTLKLARVVPIHKGGSRTDVSNYRPISLLTSFSKIYEKLMHHRIVDFMEGNNSFYEMQYGFRAGRSCEHALLNAHNTLLNSLSKKQISLLLLIDFSKAFDMVDHDILLSKLSHYGIRGVALDWIKSYLSDREQFVSVNGKDSVKRHMKFGVPQGSILGPLLFVIYINDLPGINKLAKFILYADDANIIITGESILEIEDKLEELTRALTLWVNSNGLLLNLKKTHYMLFSSQRTDHDLNLAINNVPIQRVCEARFLGVIIDEKLTWTNHIKALKSKMSRYVGIMYRIKSSIPLEVRIQIYHSFVQSHLNFCSLVWGFSAKSNIETLFTKQKKGMRAVMPGYVNYYYKDGILPTGTKSKFNEFEILTVHNIVVRNAQIFMQKVFTSPRLLPPSVRETISHLAPRRSYDSDHETCQAWLENVGSHVHRNSLFFKGPLIYIHPESEELQTPTAVLSINVYKTDAKKALLKSQALGDVNDWRTTKFLLFNIPGLRRSSRLNSEK